MAKSRTAAVRQRARDCCEYCQMPAALYRTRFHVDHIVAKQHRGNDGLDNLAWACLHCNSHKGPNIAGRDSETGEVSRLFHPRTDGWRDHFAWRGAWLVGKTAIGRATIGVLSMNDPRYVNAREALIAERKFPPL